MVNPLLFFEQKKRANLDSVGPLCFCCCKSGLDQFEAADAGAFAAAGDAVGATTTPLAPGAAVVGVVAGADIAADP